MPRGSVSGERYYGGFSGHNWGIIETSYSTTYVVPGGSRVDAFAGTNWSRGASSTSFNCFYDVNVCEDTTSQTARGLIAGQMRDPNSFSLSCWSDDPNWGMVAGGVPQLFWEAPEMPDLPQPSIDWFSGNGTLDDPYLICSLDDFLQIDRASVLWSKCFSLMCDLDLNDVNFSPVGFCQGTAFSGDFDGNEHAVSNMCLWGGRHMGLFAYLNRGGKVRNLHLEDAEVSGEAYLGAIVGTNFGTLVNCSATGYVHGDSQLGILCGINQGVLSGCLGRGVAIGDEFVGGVAGNNYYGDILNCASEAELSASSYLGGVSGWCYKGIVKDCYSDSRIQGEEDYGGIVGSVSHGTILDCLSLSSWVSGDPNAQTVAIVGENSYSLVNRSFYLLQASSEELDAEYGSGKSLAELQDRSLYTHWDFFGTNSDGMQDVWCGLPELPPISTLVAELPDLHQVPDLSSRTLGYGRMTLDHMGLKNGWVVTQSSGSIPAGLIVDVVPHFIQKHEFFNIIVSSGPYDWSTNPGKGTLESPYEISEDRHFVALTAQHELWDKHFILTDDIDLAGVTYTKAPLSPRFNGLQRYHYDGYSFQGVLDGNQHVIRNLMISHCSSQFVGLIGVIAEEGIVKNLKLTDVLIYGNVVGGGIASANFGTIEDCSVEGVFNVDEYVGGIVGWNTGRIERSTATGILCGEREVGGLVGLNEGTIRQCSAGSSSDQVRGGQGGGGLVGDNYWGSLSDCYAINGFVLEHSYLDIYGVGGLTGICEGGSIARCYAVSEFTLKDEVTAIGGLVGDFVEGSIEACFYRKTSDSQIPGSSIGQGLSEEIMKEVSSFVDAGWDFVDETDNGTDDIWFMPEDDYPQLVQ